jgi:hypothetical protein
MYTKDSILNRKLKMAPFTPDSMALFRRIKWHGLTGITGTICFGFFGIGNLFVIDTTPNNELKNFDFSVKKSFYQEH